MFCLFSVSFFFCEAQLFGNEWIKINQDYYKIKIGKEGIYKIDFNALQAVGFPVGSINPKNIQLWVNGQEIPILINDESDNKFDASDYIEFYGNYNKGDLDAPLYPNAAEQPHKYMSLYSDTATYFLTVSASAQGKRIDVIIDKNYTGKKSDSYFNYEQVIWFNNKNSGTAYDGLGFTTEGFHSEYTEGEGWAKFFDGKGTKFSFLTPFLSAGGPSPYLELLGHPRANNTTSYDIEGANNGLQIDYDPSGTLIDSKKMRGYGRYLFTDSLDKTFISTSSTSFKISSFLLAKSVHSVSYIKLQYPRLFNMNDSSKINFNYASNNNFVKFAKYKTGKTKPIIYDVINFTKSIGEVIGGELYCNLSTANTNKSLYILDETNIISLVAGNLKPYKFSALQIQSSHTYLIISNHKLDSGATAYQNYLNSNQGGNHNTYLAFTNDIYDQFYYGLKHPMAIQNFCRYALNSSANLKYLLLLGKGQKYTNTRFNSTLSLNFDLVPTYGIPPSDYFFTSGFNSSIYNPLLVTGRVPASTNTQIANYLAKLASNNLYGYQPWKKNLLQLAGGNNTSEVSQFTSYQNTFYNIVKNKKWGAERKLITKEDPSPIDSSLKSKIQAEINKGYALVDYFGHGSTQASDIDLGEAYQLNNLNKYPFFYFNGCGLGNTFDGTSLAEDFIFTKNKGAIGWMAGSTFGYMGELYRYAILLHQNLTDNPTLSFAENIAKTINTYQVEGNVYNRAQCRQLLFMGEPSIRLFEATKPDYTTDAAKSYMNPRKATAEIDSFSLVIYLKNLGLYTNDSFSIKVSQTLPNNQIIQYKSKIRKSFGYADSIIYGIKRSKNLNMKGLNTFTISLDTANKVDEQYPDGEANNSSTMKHYFSSSNAQVLFPRKDGIISTANVELIAQSLIYLNKDLSFVFELDTIPSFNSPYIKSSGTITSSYIAKHTFSLLPIDSVDYYWRVKIEDGSGISNWDVSTFANIINSPQGWSQGYYGKFAETPKSLLVYDTARRLEYTTTQSLPYIIETAGKNNSSTGRTIWHEGYPLYFGYISKTGILAVAINPKNEERFCMESKFNVTSNASPWWGSPTNYLKKYFENPGVSKSCSYYFNTSQKADKDSFLYFLQKIPDNFHLMILTGPTHNIPNWEPQLLDALEKFGAAKVRTVKDGEPYILVGRKGLLPGAAVEKTTDPGNPLPGSSQYISSSSTLDILADSGQMSSTLIGPAKSWKYFYRTLKPKDSPNDLVKFNLYGVSSTGKSTILYQDLSARETSIKDIDANKFPYLKVEAIIEDSIEKTPTGIGRWTVLYDGFPEGVINPQAVLYQNKDTLDEGDTLKVKVAYSNISSFDMDSLLVLVTSINSLNKEDTIEFKKYENLKTQSNFLFDKKLSTAGRQGISTLRVSVNPNMVQPEEYLFNNIWNFQYAVRKDIRNPYLDVVFDGRHILNKEIISPNPVITMTATDENTFSFMNNPEYFKVKLKSPGSTIFKLLNVFSDTFSFIPAKGPNEKCKLVFSPRNLKDGIYELAVSVSDASGNFAATEDYKISFQIVSKSTITNLYPYPNPFTTKTKFVFTLTGERVPDYFKITIISISGTVVKEITLDELGALNIGNNISQYEWPGTDEYGDKLANGVYLYKVTAKLDGKDIELSESAGDSNFKKGYGKLYIMR